MREHTEKALVRIWRETEGKDKYREQRLIGFMESLRQDLNDPYYDSNVFLEWLDVLDLFDLVNVQLYTKAA